jgi:putative flippase GtrA
MVDPSGERAELYRMTLKRQIAGFLAIGAINSALTFSLYLVLLLLMPYWLAYTLAFVAGVAFALTGNARLVGRRVNPAAALCFSASHMLSYLLGMAAVLFLVERLHLASPLAPIAALAITVPLSFCGTRLALRQAPLRQEPR